jgi:hypothetical protein
MTDVKMSDLRVSIVMEDAHRMEKPYIQGQRGEGEISTRS